MEANDLRTIASTGPQPTHAPGINRWHIAAAIGFIFGLWFAIDIVRVALLQAKGWPALHSAAPEAARLVVYGTLLPWPFVGALLFGAAVNFFIARGAVDLVARQAVKLPPYPFDPNKLQLVLGEKHNQDGTRSDRPSWMILPEEGLYTGILITGATGAAKTSGAHYPYIAQLLRIHANDPKRKLGGLITDAKGNYAAYAREQCARAGRLADFYEVGLDTGVYYNCLSRPDLTAAALAGHVADMIRNVQGQGGNKQDAFWTDAGRDLATQAFRLVRLAEDREATFVDLYRLITSQRLFGAWLEAAAERVKSIRTRRFDPLNNMTLPADTAERILYEHNSLGFWCADKWDKFDDRMRGNIAAGLNGVVSLFDTYEFRKAFAPTREEENFRGFDDLIREGKIVCLRLPASEFKAAGDVIATMTKLNFFDAVLRRLSLAAGGEVGRPVFFAADEYDTMLSAPGDGNFFSKCREARAICMLATQSYESFEEKLHDQHATGRILANLRTKIWGCCEDTYTAKQASELCGDVEKVKVSRTRQESVPHSAFSHLDRQIVATSAGSVGENIQESTQREALFLARIFTMLRKNQFIVKMFDGSRVHEPTVLYLKARYENPNVSWFDTPAGKGFENFNQKD